MDPEILFLTDADSAEDQPLCAGNTPRVGRSSLVLPVGFPLESDDGHVVVRFAQPLPGKAPTVVWSGVLEFPSGRALATNWSMRPWAEAEVALGTNLVDVLGPDPEVGGLTIFLTPHH